MFAFQVQFFCLALAFVVGIFFVNLTHQAEPGRMFAFQVQLFYYPFHSRLRLNIFLPRVLIRPSLDACSRFRLGFFININYSLIKLNSP